MSSDSADLIRFLTRPKRPVISGDFGSRVPIGRGSSVVFELALAQCPNAKAQLFGPARGTRNNPIFDFENGFVRRFRRVIVEMSPYDLSR